MTLSRTARTRTEPHWHLVGLFSGLAFVIMLAYARFMPEKLDAFDSLVTPHLAALQSFASVEFFLSITALGGVIGVSVVVLGTIFFLRHSRQGITQLLLAFIGAGVSMTLAKDYVERIRPTLLTWLTPETSFSFPSGHATLSMAVYGFIAISLYRRANSVTTKIAAIIVPSIVILAIGLSRMVLSYHYATDVLAGFLLGFFWLSVVFMLPRSVLRMGA